MWLQWRALLSDDDADDDGVHADDVGGGGADDENGDREGEDGEDCVAHFDKGTFTFTLRQWNKIPPRTRRDFTFLNIPKVMLISMMLSLLQKMLKISYYDCRCCR